MNISLLFIAKFVLQIKVASTIDSKRLIEEERQCG